MESIETIGCRIYMAENDMYLASRKLAADLHELEGAITALRDRLHETLCQNGRQPVQGQAREIIADVTATVGSLDLTGLRRQTRRVEDAVAQVDELEEQLVSGAPVAALAAVA
jgi:hypothetical protein